MDLILSYWRYLALIVLVFSIVILLLIGFYCAKVVRFLFMKKKLGQIQNNEKLLLLKIPFLCIVALVFINLIFIFFGVNSLFITITNSFLVLFLGFALVLLIDFIIDIWRKAWEEDEILQQRMESLGYAKWFLRVVVILSAVFFLMVVWRVELSELVGVLETIRDVSLLNSLAVLLVFVLLSYSVLYIFKTYLKNIVVQKEIPYDNIIISRIEYPVSIIILLIGVSVSLKQFRVGGSFFVPFINTLIALMLMYTIMVVVENLIDYWERKIKGQKDFNVDEGVFVLAQNVSKVLIIFVVILSILFIWDFVDELKGVLLSLSVLGVVLGISMRETFANVVAGISLMLDNTFQRNDLIQLEDSNIGIVKKIGLRSTQLMTFDNELLTVPNLTIATTKVLNYTQPDSKARITIDIGVEHGSDPKRVENILLGVVKNKDFVIYPEKTDVWFTKIDENSMGFMLLFYVRDFMESFKIKSDTTKEIYYALEKNKISVAFPKRIIFKENGRRSNSSQRNKKRNAGKSK